MPEYPVNKPLTPNECIDVVFRRIRALLEVDIHEHCALKLAAHEFNVEYKRLLYLWLNQAPNGA